MQNSLVKSDDILSQWEKLSPMKISPYDILTDKVYILKKNTETGNTK